MFKKILASFLICFLLVCPLTLSACKKKNNNSDPGTPPGTTTPTPEPTPGTTPEPTPEPTPEILSIGLDGELKTEFYKGEQLNIEGINLLVAYQLDTAATTVALSSSMISGFDSSTVGEHTLTITYGGKTLSHTYTVREMKATNIEIKTPFNTEYYTGSPLNIKNGEITATYENGESVDLDVTAEMISGFDSSEAGEFKLTLTHAGFSIEIDYVVSDAEITGIAISSQFKTTYFVNEELNLDGGAIVATYEDGKSEILSITEEMVGETFDSTTAGSKIMTITYKETSVEVPYKINLIEATGISVESRFNKTEYREGEDLDIAGGKIRVYYNNNTSQVVDITASMVSGFNNTYVNENEKTLTITHLGFTTTIKYKIIRITVTALELTQPFKTEYFEWEEINLTGGLLKATYSNGSVKENIVVTEAMISEFFADTVGTSTMYITYETFTIECKYTIKAIEAISIEVTTQPTKTTYYVGDLLSSLDLTGCVITIYYNNGTSDTISATDLKVTKTGFTTYEAGEKVLTLKYGKFTTTLTYTVVEQPAQNPAD